MPANKQAEPIPAANPAGRKRDSYAGGLHRRRRWNEKPERNRALIQAALDGAPRKELAAMYGITAGRVNTLVRQHLLRVAHASE